MVRRALVVTGAGALACFTLGCRRVAIAPHTQARTDRPATHPDPITPTITSARETALEWTLVPARLPTPVSNNAVASTVVDGRATIVSMMGLTGAKTHADIVRETVTYRPGDATFAPAADTLGDHGRLAGSAVGLDAHVLLFGGYTVTADGHEVSVPRVERYDPTSDRWSEATTMPIPVDDAVVGQWRDRVVLVSGWSNVDNVDNVQWLEPATGQWTAATPIVGPTVFGHAGAVVGDTIVYCDGVEKSPTGYQAVDACYRGDIDAVDPTTIEWTPIPSHPGPARYRMATGALPDRGWVVFAGGTANPYNYDGVGYDGVPSEPVRDVFAWDTQQWIPLPPLPEPLMDHRGMVLAEGALYIVGGLDAQRLPSDRVYRLGPR